MPQNRVYPIIKIMKTLMRGFLSLSPIAITIILIIWIFNQLEYLFGIPVKKILGPYYFPGLGIIVALVFCYVVGLLLKHWLAQYLYNWFENLMKKIPLLKTIYTSITDLMSFFQTGEQKKQGKIVVVEYNNMRTIGIVTRETFDDLPEGIGKADEVAVFFPFSYQIGGFTIVVPKSMVKPIDYSLEKGLRWAVTAGNPSADKPTYESDKSKPPSK